MSNKLTTLGYVLKRLRDSGYVVTKLFSDYGESDPRYWTLIIDPGKASVFITCYVNDPFVGDDFFEIYDGNQYIPGRLKLKTSSFEVLVEHLNKYGIHGTKTLALEEKQKFAL